MMQEMGDFSEIKFWEAYVNVHWVSADKTRISLGTFLERDFQLEPRVLIN
jgi:hypothetical protein